MDGTAPNQVPKSMSFGLLIYQFVPLSHLFPDIVSLSRCQLEVCVALRVGRGARCFTLLLAQHQLRRTGPGWKRTIALIFVVES